MPPRHAAPQHVRGVNQDADADDVVPHGPLSLSAPNGRQLLQHLLPEGDLLILEEQVHPKELQLRAYQPVQIVKVLVEGVVGLLRPLLQPDQVGTQILVRPDEQQVVDVGLPDAAAVGRQHAKRCVRNEARGPSTHGRAPDHAPSQRSVHTVVHAHLDGVAKLVERRFAIDTGGLLPLVDEEPYLGLVEEIKGDAHAHVLIHRVSPGDDASSGRILPGLVPGKDLAHALDFLQLLRGEQLPEADVDGVLCLLRGERARGLVQLWGGHSPVPAAILQEPPSLLPAQLKRGPLRQLGHASIVNHSQWLGLQREGSLPALLTDAVGMRGQSAVTLTNHRVRQSLPAHTQQFSY
ncbi:MAG: hypothetical protein COB15_12090 [Flavobacteriales bacterium]|nr:MAG: hypothetical protein COB15_12090 [Flavobacteriales bacterium]